MSTAVAQQSTNPLVAYFQEFAKLRETRLEYWATQVINVLDCVIFFGIINYATVILSEVYGFDDKQAGWIFTTMSATTTLLLFASGLVTDWLGIRPSFYIAMGGALLLRLIVVWTALDPTVPYRSQIIIGTFIAMAPFMAMVQTLFQSATRRFTTAKSRGAGFDMWYLCMNIGAAGGGFIIDFLRLYLKISIGHMFTYGAFAAVASIMIAAIFLRRDEQLVGPDESADEAARKVERVSPIEGLMRVGTSPTFWRFTLLVTLLLGVRAVFFYMAVLLPKFWLRVIGPDAAVGFLQAINPILIVIGIPLMLPIQRKFQIFSMLVFGAVISSFSLLVLVFSGYGSQAFWVSVAALVVLSIGELIWSPRLNEYTAAIAPKGQEGVYLGLSLLPWFLAKSVAGALSGYMLASFCPDETMGARLAAGTVAFWQSPSAMWIILWVPAIAGPVLAFIFRGFFLRGADFGKSESSGH